MAAIPHTRRRALLHRSGAPWLSIALCEPTRSGGRKGSLLKRDITRVITPGTGAWRRAMPGRPSQHLAWRRRWRAGPLGPGDSADVSTANSGFSERVGSDSLYQELACSWRPLSLLLASRRSGPLPNSWVPLTLLPTQPATATSTPFSAPEARRTLLERFELASSRNGWAWAKKRPRLALMLRAVATGFASAVPR